jgi:hypothetical protein
LSSEEKFLEHEFEAEETGMKNRKSRTIQTDGNSKTVAIETDGNSKTVAIETDGNSKTVAIETDGNSGNIQTDGNSQTIHVPLRNQHSDTNPLSCDVNVTMTSEDFPAKISTVSDSDFATNALFTNEFPSARHGILSPLNLPENTTGLAVASGITDINIDQEKMEKCLTPKDFKDILDDYEQSQTEKKSKRKKKSKKKRKRRTCEKEEFECEKKSKKQNIHHRLSMIITWTPR